VVVDLDVVVVVNGIGNVTNAPRKSVTQESGCTAPMYARAVERPPIQIAPNPRPAPSGGIFDLGDPGA